jgi:prepilin-type processing-associated H-X9-DG protein
MYLQENHYTYPPRLWSSSSSYITKNGGRWYNTHAEGSGTYCLNQIDAILGKTYKTSEGKTFLCPSDLNLVWGKSTNQLSYGYNFYGGPGDLKWTGLDLVRATEVKQSTRTILAVDSIHYGIVYGGLTPLSSDYDTLSVGDRHDGKANVLWCDGHVDLHAKGEVDTTTAWWTRYAD